jgi:uncharacterized glyoxalase superfamily protein PhnB
MSAGAKNTTATIITGLRYHDATKAVGWLCRAFGFEEHFVAHDEEGAVHHAPLVFGNGMIMVGPARDDDYGRLIAQPADNEGRETQAPYIIVEDAYAHFERAKDAGADVIMAPEDQPQGGQLYTVRDPEGHLWNFGTYDPWETASGDQ